MVIYMIFQGKSTPLKNISDFRMQIADYKKVKKIHQISSVPIYWGRIKVKRG